MNMDSIYFCKNIERIIHKDRPGDFTEALMDLGAKICKVRSPKCVICPLSKNCKTFKKDIILGSCVLLF